MSSVSLFQQTLTNTSLQCIISITISTDPGKHQPTICHQYHKNISLQCVTCITTATDPDNTWQWVISITISTDPGKHQSTMGLQYHNFYRPPTPDNSVTSVSQFPQTLWKPTCYKQKSSRHHTGQRKREKRLHRRLAKAYLCPRAGGSLSRRVDPEACRCVPTGAWWVYTVWRLAGGAGETWGTEQCPESCEVSGEPLKQQNDAGQHGCSALLGSARPEQATHKCNSIITGLAGPKRENANVTDALMA